MSAFPELHPDQSRNDPRTSAYIDLLKRSLIGWDQVGTRDLLPFAWMYDDSRFRKRRWRFLSSCLKRFGISLARERLITARDRLEGIDWPRQARTMIGWKRLTQCEMAIRDVVAKSIPGNFVEAGVWRGGCLLLATALFEELNAEDREVIGLDSFEGMPKPYVQKYPVDQTQDYRHFTALAVSENEVRQGFLHYGLPMERVRLIKGWFRDTLPAMESEPIAVLRLDGDLFESNYLCLNHLEPKVSPGGYIIIDDYHSIAVCRQAIDEYRREQGIESPIGPIDEFGVFWKKNSL